MEQVFICGASMPLRDYTSVCCELKEVKLPRLLRLNWQKLAALFFLPLVSLRLLRLPCIIKFSISFSFSCSSFKKKSTSTLFSFLICSLISLGMSGIIQSTSTLRNITRFCHRGENTYIGTYVSRKKKSQQSRESKSTYCRDVWHICSYPGHFAYLIKTPIALLNISQTFLLNKIKI